MFSLQPKHPKTSTSTVKAYYWHFLLPRIVSVTSFISYVLYTIISHRRTLPIIGEKTCNSECPPIGAFTVSDAFKLLKTSRISLFAPFYTYVGNNCDVWFPTIQFPQLINSDRFISWTNWRHSPQQLFQLKVAVLISSQVHTRADIIQEAAVNFVIITWNKTDTCAVNKVHSFRVLGRFSKRLPAFR